ncbi:MarR family winged helix-turn-helix transcriptional regulator [Priestia filamentosa]
MWKVTGAWQRLITKKLSPFNLTHVQFILLSANEFLSSHGENVTQKKLSDFTGTNIMMVSDVVRTLQAKGLIIRSKNPSDKREMILSTTKQGTQKVKDVLPIVEAVDEEFFGNINNEQETLIAMLSSLLEEEREKDQVKLR